MKNSSVQGNKNKQQDPTWHRKAAATSRQIQTPAMEPREWLLVVAICLCCFFGIPIRISKDPSGESEERLFKDYVKKFNKSYSENESDYLVRFKNFKSSLRLIEELNRKRTSEQSALYGLTVFSDLSPDEFFRRNLQRTPHHLPRTHEPPRGERPPGTAPRHRTRRSEGVPPKAGRGEPGKGLPQKVDWREAGVVGVVHNQKTCGACWAFSTIETAESMNALKVGSLVELSVQEVIDCARYGNYGCDGGDSCALLSWLAATKTKITTGKLYPFTYKTGVCKINKAKTGVQIQNFSCENFTGAEHLLLRKIAFHGPVAAAVNAVNWQYYLGGVIQYHCTGAPRDLNHAVQIVGYDRTGPVPYYIARNSWGTEFGDQGYVYIAIGGNTCGLANEVTSLDVA